MVLRKNILKSMQDENVFIQKKKVFYVYLLTLIYILVFWIIKLKSNKNECFKFTTYNIILY